MPGPNLGRLTTLVTSFEAMADCADFAAKQKALLRKCDEAYAIASIGRSYTDKKGIEHNEPEATAMIKCIELAARLLGVLTEAEKRAKEGDGDPRQADLDRIISLLDSVGYEVKRRAA